MEDQYLEAPTEDERPIPFITLDEETHKFAVCDEAVERLRRVQGDVAVVSIAGLYRTGKSFLLNLLMERFGIAGFDVGGTVNACTKGIWLWGRPLKLRDQDLTVVFLDTEGLGSKDRSQTDITRIFALALLLASTFIYNSRGLIGGSAIEDLSLVINLTKHIHVKAHSDAEEDTGEDYHAFFPSFVWVVRDFTLQLLEGGHEITPNEYLESALKPQSGFSEKAAAKNQVRTLLSHFFQRRDCHTLVRPLIDEEKLRALSSQPWESLREDFRGGVSSLRARLFRGLNAKALYGRVLNGAMLADLTKEYVEAINAGGVPTISTAWSRVVEVQTKAALDAAVSEYDVAIEARLLKPLHPARAAVSAGEVVAADETAPLRLPVEASELHRLHAECEGAAMVALGSRLKSSKHGSDHSADKATLHAMLGTKFEALSNINQRASLELCYWSAHMVLSDVEVTVTECEAAPGEIGDGDEEKDGTATRVATFEDSGAAVRSWSEGLSTAASRYDALARGPHKWVLWASAILGRCDVEPSHFEGVEHDDGNQPPLPPAEAKAPAQMVRPIQDALLSWGDVETEHRRVTAAGVGSDAREAKSRIAELENKVEAHVALRQQDKASFEAALSQSAAQSEKGLASLKLRFDDKDAELKRCVAQNTRLIEKNEALNNELRTQLSKTALKENEMLRQVADANQRIGEIERDHAVQLNLKLEKATARLDDLRALHSAELERTNENMNRVRTEHERERTVFKHRTKDLEVELAQALEAARVATASCSAMKNEIRTLREEAVATLREQLRGKGDAKVAESHAELVELAERGNTEAQLKLGFMYYNGRGVNTDYYKACAWYQKAAKKGNAEAQFAIGQIYYFGEGLPQSDYFAFQSWRKAAEQGHVEAQYNVGCIYEKGIVGCDRWLDKAFEWYGKAANNGHAKAQIRLCH